MVNPYMECGEELPSNLPFIVDVHFIPEGEDDLVQIDVLHHLKEEIIMFLWKTLDRNGKYLFIRHKNATWKLKVVKSNILNFDYNPYKRELTCHEGVLDKFMGWPEQIRTLDLLYDDLIALITKSRKVSPLPFRYLMKVSATFLREMEINIEWKHKEDDKTLLHLAARIDSQYLGYLLPKFKEVDTYDKDGFTPLHLACTAGLLENAKTLLAWGADVNKLTKSGNSCLMLLAQRKYHNLKFFKLLLKHNAAVDTENKSNMRAVDIAREINKTSPVIKLIHPMYSQI